MTPPTRALVDGFTAAQRAAGRSPATIRLRSDQLALIGRDLDLATATTGDLVTFLAGRDWSTERRRSVGVTLRMFYRWAVGAGQLEASPAETLPTIPRPAPNPRPTPDFVYRRAMAAADVQGRLMLRLSAELGMRRAEVAQVHTRDLEADLGGLSLVVHGKGNRTRLLPLPASLAAELEALPAGYAFPGPDGGHLSPEWVGRKVAALLEGYGMHSLRHRFATLAYHASRDVFTVQGILGHSSAETTRSYVQTTPAHARALIASLATEVA